MKVYQDLERYGVDVCPRGQRIKEIEDYQVTFQPYERLSSFRARNLNLRYCIQEFLWYLRGDRYDQSITQYATMWKKLADVDGGFNSNYGQYIFNDGDGRTHESQFDWVIRELVRDPDSRRAVMVLLNASHLRDNNVDVVCTYGLSFRIRSNRLNMSVSMRSNDAIFGLTNDAFCFSMIHEMVFVALKTRYPELTLGTYTHKVDSIHVYERHFDMLESLVLDGMWGYQEIEMPRAQELYEFTALRDNTSVEDTSFTAWMRRHASGH